MLRPLRKEAAPLSIAAGSRLGFLLAGLLCLALMAPVEPNGFLLHGGSRHPSATVDLLQRWDAYWFLNIAREGYQYHGVQPQVGRVPRQEHETNITPFPLYPLTIWLLSRVIPDPSVCGLLISLGCFLAAALLAYRLWRARLGAPMATRSLLYLALAPGAFIYGAIYSESLFLLLSIACLTLAARGRPLAAGLWGLAASATRLAGLLLAPAVLLQFVLGERGGTRRTRLADGLLCAALVASGAGLYFLYLYRLTGDPAAYFTAQQGWHKALSAPWTALISQLGPGLLTDPARWLNLASLALFGALTVATLRRRDDSLVTAGEGTYLLLGLLMPLCSSNLLGLPRYLMLLYPAYPRLARWGHTTPRHLLLCAVLAAANLPLMSAWLGWRYSL